MLFSPYRVGYTDLPHFIYSRRVWKGMEGHERWAGAVMCMKLFQ